MRKLDLLIIRSFIGPFLLTTALSTFILLIQHMLKYFDDFVGKDLGFFVFAKLLFYFSLNMLQVALPLGVLVSSLMTFGNLGENFELAAIKSSGISLLRALRPIFFFVVLISIGAFFFNDNVLPAANLKAYSLLYDIKNKKPTLDIQEGVFYKGIPNYTIKAREKFPDDITLKDVIIYDHTNTMGNTRVILADSSRMYLFMNDRYLKLELYDGNYYSEAKQRGKAIDQFNRTKYHRMDLVFSLASFEFDPTDPSLFQGNRQMMNIRELSLVIDSLHHRISQLKIQSPADASRYYKYFMEQERNAESGEQKLGNSFKENKVKTVEGDTIVGTTQSAQAQKLKTKPNQIKGKRLLEVNSIDSMSFAQLDSIATIRARNQTIVSNALQQSRNVKNTLTSSVSKISKASVQLNRHKLEKYKKYSQAFACIVMFLIGAPLGAIIKKGGLGVPVIISIFFFILYYVLSITGEEHAKADAMDGQVAVWIANAALLPVGLFFLRQARIDARLFDKDIYIIWWDKMMEKYGRRKKLVKT